MSHYAEAFFVQPGQCFRFTHSGVGHAAHCRGAIVQRGQFVDNKGKKWVVDACDVHSQDLGWPQPQPIPAR
jgi:hypothetical protein